MNEGERIATLEERTRTHDGEIDSLRETRHLHGDRLLNHEGRILATEKAVREMEDDVVPAVRKTLEQQAKEISTINSRMTKTRLDYGWWMRILSFVLMFVMAIAQAIVILQIREALAKPAPPPISAPKTHT